MSLINSIILILLAFTPLIQGGCRSSGPGDDLSVTSLQPASVSSSWDIKEIVIDCDERTSTGSYTLTFTQDEKSFIVTDSDGHEFQGTVEGDKVSWTGSYPHDGGTLTIDSSSLTISGDTISGSASRSWSAGDSICSGTSRISGTRIRDDKDAYEAWRKSIVEWYVDLYE